MARDDRFDLSVTKKNMEYAAEVAKDKRLTGDRYKLSVIDPEYGDGKGNPTADMILREHLWNSISKRLKTSSTTWITASSVKVVTG